MPLDLIQAGQAQKEVTANRLFNAMAPAALFGIQSLVGLTLKLYGGAFAGAQIANQTIALTDNSINYVQADSLSGAVSISTAGFTSGSLQLYAISVAAGVAGTPVDWRQAIGASGGAGGSGKVQALTEAANIVIDASTGSKYKLTLTADSTIANPTNLADGQNLALLIKQDSSGGHRLTLGSMFQFAGGAAPAWPTAANCMFLIRGYYDADSATIICDAVLNVPIANATAAVDPSIVFEMLFNDFTELTGKQVTQSNVTLANGQGQFNGTTSAIAVAPSADFALGNGKNSTIDILFTPTDQANGQLRALYSQRNGADHPIVLGLYNNQFFVYNGAFIIQAGTPDLNVEQHLALEEYNGTLTLFKDGAIIGTYNIANAPLGSATATLHIGADPDYGQFFQGSINAIRLRNKAAYNGQPFTPPTSF